MGGRRAVAAFVHRDDLIRMKLATGREKDLKDIAALTSHEGGAR
jgi:hypothetical protein